SRASHPAATSTSMPSSVTKSREPCNETTPSPSKACACRSLVSLAAPRVPDSPSWCVDTSTALTPSGGVLSSSVATVIGAGLSAESPSFTPRRWSPWPDGLARWLLKSGQMARSQQWIGGDLAPYHRVREGPRLIVHMTYVIAEAALAR